ncbi:MAG: methyltransferase domain-containing protein [Candidatus Binatia bacterium]
MREAIKQFVRICAATLPVSDTVYEFGSLQVPRQEGFADLRPIFPGKKYIGADIRPGPGVDVILDLHSINLLEESVGTVLVLETLEHVEFPRKAIEEVHRILKKGGILIISSVMNFPIHEHPHDYWRFTPEGFKSLLRPFDSFFVGFAGEEDFPHTVVGIGFKGSITEEAMNEFKRRFEHWKAYAATRWKRLAKLTVSRTRLEIHRKIRGKPL